MTKTWPTSNKRSERMDLERIVLQLRRLNRQVIVMKLVLSIVGIVAIYWFLLAAAPRKQGLKTDKLEITDGNGRVVMRLGSSPDGPLLQVVDGEDRLRVGIEVHPKKTLLTLRGHKGDAALQFFASDTERKILFCDEQQNTRIAIADKGDVAYISFNDTKSVTRSSLLLSKEGPALFMMNEKAVPQVALRILNEEATVKLAHGGGKGGLVLGAVKKGSMVGFVGLDNSPRLLLSDDVDESRISFRDATHRERATFRFTKDETFLEFFSAAGKRTRTFP